MDILIDLIIYLIKQASKPREPRIAPPTPREQERQRAVLAQRAQSLQKALAAQQARTRPGPAAPARQRMTTARVAPSTRPVATRLESDARPAAVVPAPTGSIVASARGRAPLPGLKIPLLLGEILAPPVALREMEF